MADQRHTPGPWEARIGDTHTVIGAWGDSICGMQRNTCSRAHAEQDANARLIAAAPELLEACKLSEAVLAEHEQYDGSEPSRESEAAQACRAALATAEPESGEEPRK